MKISPNRKRREGGNALIEFALGFTMLWVVFAGIFQFGYSMYIYNGLANAVTEGARYASRIQFDATNTTFSTRVKNMVVYGAPDATGTPLVAGLTPAKVSVTWTSDAKGIPQSITVSVTSFDVSAVFYNVVLTGKPSATVRYSGSYKS